MDRGVHPLQAVSPNSEIQQEMDVNYKYLNLSLLHVLTWA